MPRLVKNDSEYDANKQCKCSEQEATPHVWGGGTGAVTYCDNCLGLMGYFDIPRGGGAKFAVAKRNETDKTVEAQPPA